jgi:hypothetical protein
MDDSPRIKPWRRGMVLAGRGPRFLGDRRGEDARRSTSGSRGAGGWNGGGGSSGAGALAWGAGAGHSLGGRWEDQQWNRPGRAVRSTEGWRWKRHSMRNRGKGGSPRFWDADVGPSYFGRCPPCKTRGNGSSGGGYQDTRFGPFGGSLFGHAYASGRGSLILESPKLRERQRMPSGRGIQRDSKFKVLVVFLRFPP